MTSPPLSFPPSLPGESGAVLGEEKADSGVAPSRQPTAIIPLPQLLLVSGICWQWAHNPCPQPPPPSFCWDLAFAGGRHTIPAISPPHHSRKPGDRGRGGYGGAGNRVLVEGCWQSTEGCLPHDLCLWTWEAQVMSLAAW